jgi:hypothetical protein
MSGKLVQKLCEVMGAVGYIQKTGYNKQQGYKYAQETDVVEKVRAELAQRKVFLMNSVENTSFRTIRTAKGNELTVATLTVKYTFIDGESGEKLEFSGVGEGMDSGDKAVYKAQTGALKYALMKTFLIPTGDDPERDHDEEPQRQERNPQPQPQPTQKPQGLATVKQKKAIYAKAKAKGLIDEQIKKLVRYHLQRDTNNMTVKEASEIIELIDSMDGAELVQLIGAKAIEMATPITNEEIEEAMNGAT